MEENKTTGAETTTVETVAVAASVATSAGTKGPDAPKSFGVAADSQKRGAYAGRSGGASRGGQGRGAGAGGKDGKRGGPRRSDRPRPEYDQKSIEVRRVARVVAGGRRFSFSVAMIIGDRKGKVGVGTGKAGDISTSMDKAVKDAKKHMMTIALTKTNSIAHQVMSKSSSATIEIIPAPSRGLVAGSAVRNVLELAGITDVSAKIKSGSKNKLNMARATVKALTMLRSDKKPATEKTVKAEVSADAQ